MLKRKFTLLALSDIAPLATWLKPSDLKIGATFLISASI